MWFRTRCRAFAFVGLLVVTAVIGIPVSRATFAEKPAEHGERGLPDLSAIRLIDKDKAVSITLQDAFAYHGDPCPGAIVAFRGVQLAGRLLWSDAIPRREDIVILSRGSMYGLLDVFALVTRGPIECKADAISQPSKVLGSMPISRDSFAFTIVRRSTGEAVDLRVKPTVYPDEFFLLRGKAANGEATPAERGRLKRYKAGLIDAIPRRTEGELFEPPVRYRVLMFGA